MNRTLARIGRATALIARLPGLQPNPSRAVRIVLYGSWIVPVADAILTDPLSSAPHQYLWV